MTAVPASRAQLHGASQRGAGNTGSRSTRVRVSERDEEADEEEDMDMASRRRSVNRDTGEVSQGMHSRRRAGVAEERGRNWTMRRSGKVREDVAGGTGGGGLLDSLGQFFGFKGGMKDKGGTSTTYSGAGDELARGKGRTAETGNEDLNGEKGRPVQAGVRRAHKAGVEREFSDAERERVGDETENDEREDGEHDRETASGSSERVVRRNGSFNAPSAAGPGDGVEEGEPEGVVAARGNSASGDDEEEEEEGDDLSVNDMREMVRLFRRLFSSMERVLDSKGMEKVVRKVSITDGGAERKDGALPDVRATLAEVDRLNRRRELERQVRVAEEDDRISRKKDEEDAAADEAERVVTELPRAAPAYGVRKKLLTTPTAEKEARDKAFAWFP